MCTQWAKGEGFGNRVTVPSTLCLVMVMVQKWRKLAPESSNNSDSRVDPGPLFWIWPGDLEFSLLDNPQVF